MRSKQHHFAGGIVRCVTIALMAALTTPTFAQSDVQAAVLKHLKTSRDFTLKVADQMPEATYNFKLTPPQMSFGEQMVHLSQAQDEDLSAFAGQAPNPGKPTSMNKKDVMAFVRKSFDSSIEKVSKLTPAQLSKTYTTGEGTRSGLDLLL